MADIAPMNWSIQKNTSVNEWMNEWMVLIDNIRPQVEMSSSLEQTPNQIKLYWSHAHI